MKSIFILLKLIFIQTRLFLVKMLLEITMKPLRLTQKYIVKKRKFKRCPTKYPFNTKAGCIEGTEVKKIRIIENK